MNENQRCGGLDIFRIIAALLVIAIHTSPLSTFSGSADFFCARMLARLAVPFFLMVTGQFILSDYLSGAQKSAAPIWKYLKKTLLLYGIAILLYLPIGIYAGLYNAFDLTSAFRMLLFDGPFYHLWYFPALILGLLLLYPMLRFCSLRTSTVIVSALYLIGLMGDSYWGLISNIPGLSTVYEWGFQLFTYTRNGLFLAPLFLLMGAAIGMKPRSRKPILNAAAFAFTFLLMTAEGFLLHHLNLQRHDSMYLALPICVFFLYRLLLTWDFRPLKKLRSVSAWMYLLHPAVIVAVRGAAKVFHATSLLVGNSLIHYTAVCGCSAFAAFVITAALPSKNPPPFEKDRAWIELNRNALHHNVSELRARLPESCALMPAVKANAYGHGAIPIAKELNRIGIHAFCVASIFEGIELRQKGISGTILILGYTHPMQFFLLRRYRLTQTVIDYPYAVELNRYGKQLRVQIGIDTGMHRLGERSEHIEQLCQLFQMKNLKIEGAYTHLCVSNTYLPQDQAFTQKQARAFYGVISELKARGFNCPKIHLLASSGVLNYPEFAGDYARVGIALYGVRSSKQDYDRSAANLQPVLSLKARIAAVKALDQGERAGYGLALVASHPMKIAILSIGYADGLPRSLSCGVGAVLINGHRAPIVGRICMDQTIADITHIPNVTAGDTAVQIGISGSEIISVYEIAEKTDSITNEVLSLLGARLNRTII